MLTMPFTIGVFMVRDFEAAKHGSSIHAVDEQVVGRLTGLLVSTAAVSISVFHTLAHSNCRSERHVRKPTQRPHASG